MKYLVVELFPDIKYASIVCNEDGINKVFTEEEALKEVENCQNGILIGIQGDFDEE